MTETTASSRQRKTRRGFNLIEAAIVLGVVGLVIGGIWVGAATISDNQKVSSTASGLLSICQALQNVYPKALTRSSGPPADITLSAIAAGVVPADWLTGSTVTAPIGSLVEIWEITSSSDYYVHIPDEGGIHPISLTDVPQKYCRRLVPFLNQARPMSLWITLYTASDGLYQWEAPWHGMGTVIEMADCGNGPVDIEIGCAPGTGR